MMKGIITRELIDVIAPEHGRSSCSDENTINGYGGWTGKYDRDTGRKEVRYPRCNRCYLLNNIDCRFEDLDFQFGMLPSYDPLGEGR